MLFGWRKRAQKPPTPTQGVTKEIVAAAFALASEYGAWLEDHPVFIEICDEKLLPRLKDTLLNALIIAVMASKDETYRAGCWMSALSLSQFQKDVGPDPLLHGGMSISQFNSAYADVGKISGEELLSKFVGNPDRSARYEHFRPLVDGDRKRIGGLMTKANTHEGG
jgi:hypothetical protein